jgi:hypothetical protein
MMEGFMQTSSIWNSSVPKMPKLTDAKDHAQIESNGPPLLQIYVASHCVNCEEARRLAGVIGLLLPNLIVEVIDLDHTPTRPTEVFATPTYMLNGRICFLGNPSEEELCDLLGDMTDS